MESACLREDQAPRQRAGLSSRAARATTAQVWQALAGGQSAGRDAGAWEGYPADMAGILSNGGRKGTSAAASIDRAVACLQIVWGELSKAPLGF